MTGPRAAKEELEEKLAVLIGQPVGSRGVSVAPDPVNQPMIRHWAAAFEDTNPVYTDPERAARSRFGGIVAPPLMLQTWTMATPTITGIAERGGSPVETEGPGPLAVLDDAGYVGTLATNSQFEIFRYLRLGDVVSAASTFESVSEEKQTRLGPGRFVTWTTVYTDEADEVVGRQRFTILKFKPEGAPRMSRPSRTVDGTVRSTTLTSDAIGVSDELPAMRIEVTATVIVAGAIATRDFMPVHHDRTYANGQGAPDIFMNILSDSAYCSRFLTDWAGPDAMVKRLAIRLGVPMFPGSTLLYTGRVTARQERDKEGIVQVEFRAVNDLGEHLRGTAEVGLPSRPPLG